MILDSSPLPWLTRERGKEEERKSVVCVLFCAMTVVRCIIHQLDVAFFTFLQDIPYYELDRSHQSKRKMINLLLFGKFRTIGDTVPRRAGDLFIAVRIATYLIYFWRSGRGLDGDAALLPALLTFAGIRKSFLFFGLGYA